MTDIMDGSVAILNKVLQDGSVALSPRLQWVLGNRYCSIPSSSGLEELVLPCLFKQHQWSRSWGLGLPDPRNSVLQSSLMKYL